MHADPARSRQDVFGLQLVLLLGHNGGCDGTYTEAQLRRGWGVYRRELTELRERPRGRPAERPWAWWVFDRGFEAEPDFDAAVAYLLEHELLTDWELERLGFQC
jgi:hypothetical protein